MIKQVFPRVCRWCAIVAIVVALTGCLGNGSPHVSYYSLLTAQQLSEGLPVASLPEVKLGVGPISIPDSLKRSQIATRQQGNLYAFDEFHRWAGTLEKDLSYVLGENLEKMLGLGEVGILPWQPHFQPTYRVIMNVTHFDGDLKGEAVLSAHWVVADTSGKAVLAGGRSEYRQPLEAETYAALISTESQLVAQLSHEIAIAIATLKN